MAALPVLLIWTPHIVADTHVVFKVLKQLHYIGTNSEEARVLGKWQYNNFQNKKFGVWKYCLLEGEGGKKDIFLRIWSMENLTSFEAIHISDWPCLQSWFGQVKLFAKYLIHLAKYSQNVQFPTDVQLASAD